MILVAGSSLILLWPRWLENRYASEILSAADVPAARVAIVFGARVYPSGRLSGMLRDRVDTRLTFTRPARSTSC